MNYLAHQFLSGTNKEIRVGNFLGDFMKGKDLEDFSDEFQADFSEGLYDVRNNYGYDYHKACSECTREIREHIHDMEQENEYQEMMEQEWYLNQQG